jgi:hypothetical protein
MVSNFIPNIEGSDEDFGGRISTKLPTNCDPRGIRSPFDPTKTRFVLVITASPTFNFAASSVREKVIGMAVQAGRDNVNWGAWEAAKLQQNAKENANCDVT